MVFPSMKCIAASSNNSVSCWINAEGSSWNYYIYVIYQAISDYKMENHRKESPSTVYLLNESAESYRLSAKWGNVRFETKNWMELVHGISHCGRTNYAIWTNLGAKFAENNWESFICRREVDPINRYAVIYHQTWILKKTA